MTSIIDEVGGIVIPKAIRDAAGLEPGTRVRFRVIAGRVEVEPVPLEVTLEQRGPTVVAVPSQKQPALKASMVERTMDMVRDRGIAPRDS